MYEPSMRISFDTHHLSTHCQPLTISLDTAESSFIDANLPSIANIMDHAQNSSTSCLVTAENTNSASMDSLDDKSNTTFANTGLEKRKDCLESDWNWSTSPRESDENDGEIAEDEDECANCPKCGEQSCGCTPRCRVCDEWFTCDWREDCSVCGLRIEACDACHDCGLCGEPWCSCTCDKCSKCIEADILCSCKTCFPCSQKLPICKCPSCKICDQVAQQCKCAHPSVPRIKVTFGSILTSHVHFERLQATDPEQERSQDVESFYYYAGDVIWREPQKSMKVIIEGEYTHIVAFRNPIPVWKKATKDTMQEAKRRLTNRINSCHQTLRKHIAFRLEPEMEATHVNVKTVSGIRRLVTTLASLPKDEPNISFDMECHSLGPYEKPCILAIRDETVPRDYLVDLVTLKDKAWTTKNKDGLSLRHIFEDVTISKLIFAVAQDAVSLFAAYGMRLAGVIDLQTMYLLRQRVMPEFKPNLSKTVAYCADLSSDEIKQFDNQKGRQPGTWWRYKDIRPLLQYDKEYALNDLKYLKRMYKNMVQRLDLDELQAVKDFSHLEVENACRWPDGWSEQGARVRDELRDWWKERHPGGLLAEDVFHRVFA